MKEKIATWVLGILAIVTFFFGVIDAMSQRRSREDKKSKAEKYREDSLNAERLKQRASDSIAYLNNDLWDSIKKKNNVTPYSSEQ